MSLSVSSIFCFFPPSPFFLPFQYRRRGSLGSKVASWDPLVSLPRWQRLLPAVPGKEGRYGERSMYVCICMHVCPHVCVIISPPGIDQLIGFFYPRWFLNNSSPPSLLTNHMSPPLNITYTYTHTFMYININIHATYNTYPVVEERRCVVDHGWWVFEVERPWKEGRKADI